jgi:hypothetical protein
MILRDYGKNIYKINLRIAIFTTLKRNIIGKKRKKKSIIFKLIVTEYESLRE